MRQSEPSRPRRNCSTYHDRTQADATQPQDRNGILRPRLRDVDHSSTPRLDTAAKRREQLELLITDQPLNIDHRRRPHDRPLRKARLPEKASLEVWRIRRRRARRVEARAAAEVEFAEADAVGRVTGLADLARAAEGEGEEHGVARRGDGDVLTDFLDVTGACLPQLVGFHFSIRGRGRVGSSSAEENERTLVAFN